MNTRHGNSNKSDQANTHRQIINLQKEKHPMKTLGIIAEYNPFHNGHSYQIQKAREISHSDCVIIAMSGNFVQRGTPALLDKYTRTAMALKNGADFVFEIPSVFATSSAEYFAAAGIGILDALGCVDMVSFGCETPDLRLMTCLADILTEEPDAYKMILFSLLKKGLSFPAARKQAVTSYLKENTDHFGCIFEDAAILLDSPNNILALEYLKAINRSRSRLRPLPILRKGAGYHDPHLQQEFCSATAIRSRLLAESFDALHSSNRAKTSFHTMPKSGLTTFSLTTQPQSDLAGILSCYVPEYTAAQLLAPDTHFLTEQDFSEILYYKLLCEREKGFTEYADCSVELSNRILNILPSFLDYRGFCERLKSREMTYSRISRVLLHILLQITQADLEAKNTCGPAPYLRLLGFRRDAAKLFGEIKMHARRPLITKPSKADGLLTMEALSVFRKDVFSSDLYYGMLARKSGKEQKTELRREMIIL